MVDALQALRGVSFVPAVGLVVEVGDIRRFDHPRQLMAFLGLVPSEYSSGPSVRRGGARVSGRGRRCVVTWRGRRSRWGNATAAWTPRAAGHSAASAARIHATDSSVRRWGSARQYKWTKKICP